MYSRALHQLLVAHNISNRGMVVEKLNAWAHMIHTGKHESCEIPPDILYFSKEKKMCDPSAHNMALSPGKRIS